MVVSVPTHWFPTLLFIDDIDDPDLVEAGSRTVLQVLVEGLMPRGFRCLVAIRGEGRFPASLRALGAEVVPLRAPRGTSLYRRVGTWAVPSPVGFLSSAVQAPRAVLYWQDLIEDLAPDVIYVAHPLAHVLAGMGSRLASVPAVLHLQGIPQSSHRVKLLLRFYRALCEVSGATVVAISRAVAEAYGGPAGRRPRVIPNGVDTERFSPGPPIPDCIPFPSGLPVVGMVGSLDALKGIHLLPDLVRKVRQQVPAARFVMVGSEPHERTGLPPTAAQARPSPLLRGVLRRLEEGGDLDAVAFLGRRPDVPEILRGLSVLAHLCRMEGFGLAVAEAGATGIPAVAFDAGGPAEVILPGRTGILVAPKEGVDGIASAVADLIRDPSRAREMGRSAIDHIRERFSRNAFVEAFAQLFRELADRADPAPGGP